MNKKLVLLASLLALFATHRSFAESPTLASPGDDEKVDVDAIKKKYWAKGKESELGVVQNRLYTKAKKWNLGVFGGFANSDPFLSVKIAGASVGYNFTEYFALNFIYWKDFSSPSSALKTFESNLGATTNNNPPRYYIGTEAQFSLIYGKISLLGEKIIYYDLHTLLGIGRTSTNNGDYITPSVGIGQNIFISKVTAIEVDYRLQYYKEDIIERVKPSTLGQRIGQNTSWTNVITVGLTFLIGKGQQ